MKDKQQPINPKDFPTLATYPLDWIEKAVAKLMKDRNMTRQQCLVNLEQDLSEIDAQSKEAS